MKMYMYLAIWNGLDRIRNILRQVIYFMLTYTKLIGIDCKTNIGGKIGLEVWRKKAQLHAYIYIYIYIYNMYVSYTT